MLPSLSDTVMVTLTLSLLLELLLWVGALDPPVSAVEVQTRLGKLRGTRRVVHANIGSGQCTSYVPFILLLLLSKYELMKCVFSVVSYGNSHPPPLPPPPPHPLRLHYANTIWIDQNLISLPYKCCHYITLT